MRVVPWSMQQQEVTCASICCSSFLIGDISLTMISCLVRTRRSRSLKPLTKACISYLILPLRSFLEDLSWVMGINYHEWCRVVLSGFEGEREGVLSGRNEAASEVVEHIVEAGYLPWSFIFDDFLNQNSVCHISKFGRLILTWMIFRVRAVHSHPESLSDGMNTLL